MLEEPDGRSNWIRRLDGTLLTDDNSGVCGEEWGLDGGRGLAARRASRWDA